MLNLSTTAPVVSTDASGRPREIRAQGQRLAVTDLESVRDETAAYPVESGPRTVFVVMASSRRYRLVYALRDHRWTVEELAVAQPRLARAA